MPQISKKVKVEKETVSGLVEKDVADALRDYCEMVGHPAGHVLNDWLKVLFKKDAQELEEYRAKKAEEARAAKLHVA